MEKANNSTHLIAYSHAQVRAHTHNSSKVNSPKEKCIHTNPKLLFVLQATQSPRWEHSLQSTSPQEVALSFLIQERCIREPDCRCISKLCSAILYSICLNDSYIFQLIKKLEQKKKGIIINHLLKHLKSAALQTYTILISLFLNNLTQLLDQRYFSITKRKKIFLLSLNILMEFDDFIKMN